LAHPWRLSPAFRPEVDTAVRQVSNRGGNTIGRFPSLKMKRMISFESLIECDFLYLLDYEPEVERFDEQPLTIEYQCGSATLHYTPDFHILRARRKVLVEYKPQTLVGTEENGRKFNAAITWCGEHDWTFCVVTDPDLRAGLRLKNVKLLTRYARHVVPPEVKGRFYALLETATPPRTIGQLAETLAPADPTAVMANILHLAFHHAIVVELDAAPISVNTPVGLPPRRALEA
jgi:TnsA endonuclease N terminal